MRILYLNTIGELGGSERSLLDIFAALRALEPAWELHLIAGSDGPLLAESKRLGVNAEIFPLPEEWLVLKANSNGGKIQSAWKLALRSARAGLGARNYARKLRARISEIKPGIIHSNGTKFHLLTRFMAKQSAPIVWHIRDFVGTQKLMRRALRWAAPAASVAIANSEAVAADARRVLGRTPVQTVLNGIDTERFSPAPGRGESLDELAGLPILPKEILRVGLLASYARWKGQDLFLKAAAIVAKNSPNLNARFFIIGGPLYKTLGSQFSLDELRALAESHAIADRVGFIPFQNNPQDIYRALDIVVHASTQPEPFGRTIAEAMSCGRAVVASLDGGVRELFQPDVDALSFEPNDASALTEKIEKLLRDPNIRATLGANARRTALARFSRDRLGRQLREIYTALRQ